MAQFSPKPTVKGSTSQTAGIFQGTSTPHLNLPHTTNYFPTPFNTDKIHNKSHISSISKEDKGHPNALNFSRTGKHRYLIAKFLSF